MADGPNLPQLAGRLEQSKVDPRCTCAYSADDTLINHLEQTAIKDCSVHGDATPGADAALSQQPQGGDE